MKPRKRPAHASSRWCETRRCLHGAGQPSAPSNNAVAMAAERSGSCSQSWRAPSAPQAIDLAKRTPPVAVVDLGNARRRPRDQGHELALAAQVQRVVEAAVVASGSWASKLSEHQQPVTPIHVLDQAIDRQASATRCRLPIRSGCELCGSQRAGETGRWPGLHDRESAVRATRASGSPGQRPRLPQAAATRLRSGRGHHPRNSAS